MVGARLVRADHWSGRGRIDSPAPFGQGLAEGAGVGVGARLRQQYCFCQQGLGYLKRLRGPACQQELKPLRELAGSHLEPGEQVPLPLELAMRHVDTVERQDHADHRVPGPGEQVMDREFVAAAG